jgi:hypothetical protein
MINCSLTFACGYILANVKFWLKCFLKLKVTFAKDVVIPSIPEFPIRMAFCKGPLGEEIEFFKER